MEKNWQRCKTCTHFNFKNVYCEISQININKEIMGFIEIVGCRSWDEEGVDPENRGGWY